MFKRLRAFWLQLRGKPRENGNRKKVPKYYIERRRPGGLVRTAFGQTIYKEKPPPKAYSKTFRRKKSTTTPPPSPFYTPYVTPSQSSNVIHAKSSVRLIENQESSSSDEEFTHIPSLRLRAWEMGPMDLGVDDVFIDMPKDIREVVSDPAEKEIKNWIQSSFTVLYYYWLLLVCFGVLLISLVMYMFFILDELHVKHVLIDLFWRSRYVNVGGVTALQLIVSGFGLVFLCFPEPRDWGRFRTTRWIFILIPNIVMVVGLIDQIFWMVNYQEIVGQLELLVWRSLEAAATDKNYPANVHAPMLKAQIHLRCCGVRDLNDWKRAPEFETYGYPFSCCDDQYVDSCEVPIKERTSSSFDNRSQIWQIWKKGCFHEELKVFQVTAGITWFTYIISVLSCVAFSIYMWKVIKDRNRFQIEVFHPF